MSRIPPFLVFTQTLSETELAYLTFMANHPVGGITLADLVEVSDPREILQRFKRMQELNLTDPEQNIIAMAIEFFAQQIHRQFQRLLDGNGRLGEAKNTDRLKNIFLQFFVPLLKHEKAEFLKLLRAGRITGERKTAMELQAIMNPRVLHDYFASFWCQGLTPLQISLLDRAITYYQNIPPVSESPSPRQPRGPLAGMNPAQEALVWLRANKWELAYIATIDAVEQPMGRNSTEVKAVEHAMDKANFPILPETLHIPLLLDIFNDTEIDAANEPNRRAMVTLAVLAHATLAQDHCDLLLKTIDHLRLRSPWFIGRLKFYDGAFAPFEHNRMIFDAMLTLAHMLELKTEPDPSPQSSGPHDAELATATTNVVTLRPVARKEVSQPPLESRGGNRGSYEPLVLQGALVLQADAPIALPETEAKSENISGQDVVDDPPSIAPLDDTLASPFPHTTILPIHTMNRGFRLVAMGR